MNIGRGGRKKKIGWIHKKEKGSGRGQRFITSMKRNVNRKLTNALGNLSDTEDEIEGRNEISNEAQTKDASKLEEEDINEEESSLFRSIKKESNMFEDSDSESSSKDEDDLSQELVEEYKIEETDKTENSTSKSIEDNSDRDNGGPGAVKKTIEIREDDNNIEKDDESKTVIKGSAPNDLVMTDSSNCINDIYETKASEDNPVDDKNDPSKVENSIEGDTKINTNNANHQPGRTTLIWRVILIPEHQRVL